MGSNSLFEVIEPYKKAKETLHKIYKVCPTAQKYHLLLQKIKIDIVVALRNAGEKSTLKKLIEFEESHPTALDTSKVSEKKASDKGEARSLVPAKAKKSSNEQKKGPSQKTNAEITNEAKTNTTKKTKGKLKAEKQKQQEPEMSNNASTKQVMQEQKPQNAVVETSGDSGVNEEKEEISSDTELIEKAENEAHSSDSLKVEEPTATNNESVSSRSIQPVEEELNLTAAFEASTGRRKKNKKKKTKENKAQPQTTTTTTTTSALQTETGPSKPVVQVVETMKAPDTKKDDADKEIATDAGSEEYEIQDEWEVVSKKASTNARAQSLKENALDNKQDRGTLSPSPRVVIPNSVDLVGNGIYCCCKICWIRNGNPIERVKNVRQCVSCNTMFEPIYMYKSKKKRWTEVRPRPQLVAGDFKLCLNWQRGKPCIANPCLFAHSEEELFFWKMEKNSVRNVNKEKKEDSEVLKVEIKKEGTSSAASSEIAVMMDEEVLNDHKIFNCCRTCWTRNKAGVQKNNNAPRCKKCGNLWTKVYLYRDMKGRLQEIRPRPANVLTKFSICRDRENGKPCKIQPCNFAHSEEEIFFWTMERKLANPPAAKKPISIPGPKTVLKSVHPSFLHLEKFRKEFPDVKMTIVCQGCWNVKGKFIEIIPGKAFQCSHKITQPVRVAFDSRKGVWEVIRKCLLLKSGSQFQMCQDNLKNRPCKVRPKCTSAHSEMEKFVWELERTKLANPPAVEKPIIVPDPKTVLTSVPTIFHNLEKFRKEFHDVKMTIVCQSCWSIKGEFIEISPGKAFQCRHKATQPVRVAFDPSKSVWEVIRKSPLLESGLQFQMCQDNLMNRPCKVRPKCTFAHSEMEKFVWELERTKLSNPPAVEKPVTIPGTKTNLTSFSPIFRKLENFLKKFPDVKMTIVCQGCWNVKGKFIEIIPGEPFKCGHKATQPIRVAFDSRKSVWEVIRKCPLLKSGLQFQMCQDNLMNRPCKVRSKCTLAHNEMEQIVWELERTIQQTPNKTVKHEKVSSVSSLSSMDSVESTGKAQSAEIVELIKSGFQVRELCKEIWRKHGKIFCNGEEISRLERIVCNINHICPMVRIAWDEETEYWMEVRPRGSLPIDANYKICRSMERREPCEYGKCVYAHNDVERRIWETERKMYLEMERKNAKPPQPTTPVQQPSSVTVAKEATKKRSVSIVNTSKSKNLSWAQVVKRSTGEGASSRKVYNSQPSGFSVSPSAKDKELPSLQAANTTNTLFASTSAASTTTVSVTAAVSKPNAREMYALDDFNGRYVRSNRAVEVVVTSASLSKSVDRHLIKLTTVTTVAATRTSVTASSSTIDMKNNRPSSQRSTSDSQAHMLMSKASITETADTSVSYSSPVVVPTEGIPNFPSVLLPPNMPGMLPPVLPNIENYPSVPQMLSPPGFAVPAVHVPHQKALQQEDEERGWKHRRPPNFMSSGNYRLCKWWPLGSCKFGEHCVFAHSEEEIAEWRERHKFWKIKESGQKEAYYSELTFQQDILRNLETAKDVTEVLIRHIRGISVQLTPSAVVHLDPSQSMEFKWIVQIKIQNRKVLRRLTFAKTAALFRISSVNIDGHQELLPTLTKCSSITLARADQRKMRDIRIEVLFSNRSVVLGAFSQILVLDFGSIPYLTIPLHVDVASEDRFQAVQVLSEKLSVKSGSLHDGNRKLIKNPSPQLHSEEAKLDKKYALPDTVDLVPVDVTEDNYQVFMHCMLYAEEKERRNLVEGFTLKSVNVEVINCFVDANDNYRFATNEETFGKITLPTPLSIDSLSGRLISRDAKSILLDFEGKHEIHEVEIKHITRDDIVFGLPINLLPLKVGETFTVNAQFQLNRMHLLRCHQAVDTVTEDHLQILFYSESPDKPPDVQPTNPDLNENQALAVSLITHELEEDWPSPVVITGPFGCGKSFTLQNALSVLLNFTGPRILICTRSNSAADLHMESLHENMNDDGLRLRMLRLYHKDRRIDTVSRIVRQYCLLNPAESNTSSHFRIPSKADLLQHRVIVTTFTSCHLLHKLELPTDCFTHILLDEAAQALEVEVLMAVTLAGPKTRLALVGDYLQISPEVYSPVAKERHFKQTLLERLADNFLHCGNMTNLIFLAENYRSQQEIVEFCYKTFYRIPKGFAIARTREICHPSFPPLSFFSVEGEAEEIKSDSQLPNALQYVNVHEAQEIVRRVKTLQENWPVQWGLLSNGKPDLQQIGVVTFYHDQVRLIRNQLRLQKLSSVSVETIENIQGKEFKAVFISTVRTLHSINPNQVDNLGFLSDPRLLNTAMTRAQSLVAVVGEPLTLCLFGECSHIWEQYLLACNKLKGLFGTDYKKLAEQMQSSKDNLTKLHRLISETKVKNCEEDVSFSEDDDGESIILDENVGTESEKKHGKPVLRSEKNTDLPSVRSKKNTDLPFEADLMMADGMKVTKPPRDQLRSKVENHTAAKPISSNVSEQGSDGAGQGFIKLWNDPVELPKLLEDQTRQKVVNQEVTGPVHGNHAQQDSGTTQLVSTESIGNSPLKNGKNQGQTEPKLFFEDFASRPGTSISSIVEQNGLTSSGLNEQIDETIFPSVTDQSAAMTSTSLIGSTESSDQIRNNLDVELNQQYLMPPSLENLESSSVHLSLDQLILNRDEVNQRIYSNPTMFVKCRVNILSSAVSCSVYGEPCEDEKSGLINIVSIERPVFDNDIVLVKVIKDTPSEAILKRVGIALGTIQPAIPLEERVFLCRFDKEDRLFVSVMDMHLAFFCPSDDFDNDVLETKLFALKLVSCGVCWDSQMNIFTGSVTSVLGKATDLRSSVELYKRIYGIDREIPADVVAECRSLFSRPYSFPKEKQLGRQFVDDALSILLPGRFSSDHCFTITKTPFGNYRIGIHVIDMPSFIEEDSVVDLCARARCQSLNYASTDLMPSTSLLPAELEYNAACLSVGHERPTISVFVTLTQDGDSVGEPIVCKSVTVVSDQLRADEIHIALAGSTAQYSKELVSKISLLSRVTQKLRSKRQGNTSDASGLSRLGSEMQGIQQRKQQRQCENLVMRIDEELTHAANGMITELLGILCPDEAPVLKWSSVSAFNPISNLESYHDASSAFSGEDNAHLIFSGNMNTISKAVQNRDFETIKRICSSYFDLARTAAELKVGCVSFFPQYKIGISCEEKIDEMATFTSPSQKYADILIQRLLHKYFLDSTGDDQGRGNKDKIVKICEELNCTMSNVERFKESVRRTEVAYKVDSEGRDAYLAVVKDVITFTNTETNLVNLVIFTSGIDIFRHMESAPIGLYIALNDDNNSEAWTVSMPATHHVSGSFEHSGMVIPVNNRNLADLMRAAVSEDADKVVHCWNNMLDHLRRVDAQNGNKNLSECGNLVANLDVTAEFAPGKTFPVWISSQMDIYTGLPTLDVQLLQVTEKFRSCLLHQRTPEIFIKDLHHFKIATNDETVSNIQGYRKIWKEITTIDAAVKAVKLHHIFVFPNVRLSFRFKDQDSLSLDIRLFTSKLSDSVSVGDYVCLRVPYCGLISNSQTRAQCEPKDGEFQSREFNSMWIGHGIVINIEDSACLKAIDVKINSNIPQLFTKVQLIRPVHGECEIIRRAPRRRALEQALDNLIVAPKIVQDICLRSAVFSRKPRDVEILSTIVSSLTSQKGLLKLNSQQDAILKKILFLNETFSVVAGPEGSGKTVLASVLAVSFALLNKKKASSGKEQEQAPPQVLLCSPSEDTLSKLSDILVKVEGIRILHIHDKEKEQLYLRWSGGKNDSSHMKVEGQNQSYASVSLHCRIRHEKSPFARLLGNLQNEQILNEAERFEIQGTGVDIILCTCDVAGDQRIKDYADNIQQCIIDDCDLCSEPEVLIPLLSSKPDQVVIFGDTKPCYRSFSVGRKKIDITGTLMKRYSDIAYVL